MKLEEFEHAIPLADSNAEKPAPGHHQRRYAGQRELPCWKGGEPFEAIVEDEESGMVQRQALPWHNPWD